MIYKVGVIIYVEENAWFLKKYFINWKRIVNVSLNNAQIPYYAT